MPYGRPVPRVQTNEPQRIAPQALSQHVIAGFVASALLAIGDVCVIFTDGARLPRATTVLRSMFDEWALLAILGVAVGLVVGIISYATSKSAWWAPVRVRLHAPWRWFAHDPIGFAGAIAIPLSAGLVGLLAWHAERVVTVSFAQKQFVALAMGMIAVGLVGIALIAFSLFSMVARAFARVIGRAASIGTVGVLAALCVAMALIVVRGTIIDFFQNGLWRRYAELPMIAAAYLLAIVLVTLVRKRFVRFATRLRAWALVSVATSSALILWSAFTYGHLQSVREVVERRAIVGGTATRTYLRLSDRDRDGYSSLFSDADCDDSRADVHPGAMDVRGDHVDADCFGGDGSPNVSPYGDGVYGDLPPGVHRPNIVLITVDALRSDHLGAYGYARHTTPRIDAFARTATRFTDVLAPSSRTVAAMPAMMTGYYPSQIARGTQYFYPAVLPQNTTIAESLQAAGYSTVAIASTHFFSRVEGYFQGFQTVDQVAEFHSTREWPIDSAINHIDRLREGTAPFFVWVHLFNVHADYLGDNHSSMFGPSLMDKYDTEVALMDQEVGRLLRAITERGLDATTAVVFTADHGEAFGEHGTFFHETLYDEELRPPLLVHVPHGHGAVSRAPVSTIDVAPTILNLASIPMPAPTPARSLIPLLSGGAGDRARPRFAERLPDGWASINQKTLYQGNLKLLWFLEDGRVEFYDHSTDPTEQINLADERDTQAAQMLGELRAWASQTASSTLRDDNILRENRFRRAPVHIEHRLNTRFGGIFTLLGYDLPRTAFHPGESIPFNFYYRVDQETNRELLFEVLFETPPGFPNVDWFHGRHVPLRARYPTTQWRVGEFLRDPIVIPVPPFAPSGSVIHVRFRVTDHGTLLPIEGDTTGTATLSLPDITIE